MEDFLILSKGWHDGLPCPTKEGKPGGSLVVNLYVLVYVFLSFPPISVLNKVFYFFILMISQITVLPNPNSA